MNSFGGWISAQVGVYIDGRPGARRKRGGAKEHEKQILRGVKRLNWNVRRKVEHPFAGKYFVFHSLIIFDNDCLN